VGMLRVFQGSEKILRICRVNAEPLQPRNATRAAP